MSSFGELPSELQIEIFTILSVKHLGNILLINKSIHDQIMNSEAYWTSVLKNYSRIVGFSFDLRVVNIPNIKKQITELIYLKNCALEEQDLRESDLEQMVNDLEEELEHLKMYQYKIGSDPLYSEQIEREVESLSEHIENERENLKNLKKNFDRMMID